MSSAPSLPLPPPTCCSCWAYLPGMGLPAIQSEGYKFDKELFKARAISGFALTCIALAGLYWTVPAATLLLAKGGAWSWVVRIATGILPFVPALLELQRCDEAFSRKAAEEFVSLAVVSDEAMQILCTEGSSFKHYLSLLPSLDSNIFEGKNLHNVALRNKIFSEDGSAEVRKLFIDEVSDVFENDASGKSILIRCIELGDIDALDQIAEKKLGDLSLEGLLGPNQQSDLWTHVCDAKTIQWLHQKGFTIHLPLVGKSLLDRHSKVDVLESSKALGVCIEVLKMNAWEGFENIENPSSLKQMHLIQLIDQAKRASENEEAYGLILPARGRAEAIFQSIPFQMLLLGYQLLTQAFPTVFPVLHWTRWIPLNLVSFWLEEKANKGIALRKAITEYVTEPIPSYVAALIIASSSNAAYFFRSCGWANLEAARFHMKKMSDGGNILLGQAAVQGNLELFTWLLDLGVSPFEGKEKSGFWSAIKSKDLRFVHAIFGKYPAFELSEAEAKDLWTSLMDEEIGELFAILRQKTAEDLQIPKEDLERIKNFFNAADKSFK